MVAGPQVWAKRGHLLSLGTCTVGPYKARFTCVTTFLFAQKEPKFCHQTRFTDSNCSALYPACCTQSIWIEKRPCFAAETGKQRGQRRKEWREGKKKKQRRAKNQGERWRGKGGVGLCPHL